jgi:hypothetical protein
MSSTSSPTIYEPYPPAKGSFVLYWWTEMVLISVINCILCLVIFIKTKPPTHDLKTIPQKHWWSIRYVTAMRYLAIPFVFECTWRSFLPSLYNSRTTIIDDDINSILLARFLAAIGEICWGTQIALAYVAISRSLPMRGRESVRRFILNNMPRIAKLIVLLDVTAQCFSCAGAVTTSYRYVLVEESLWTIIFLLMGISGIFLWAYGCDDWELNFIKNLPCCYRCILGNHIHTDGVDGIVHHDHHHEPAHIWVMRLFIRGSALFGWIATPYMIVYELPKWYRRYQADEAANVQALGLEDGFRDAAYRQMATQQWSAWEDDFFWMSGYFSVACFTSIMLMLAPGQVVIEKCNCHTHSHHAMASTLAGTV